MKSKDHFTIKRVGISFWVSLKPSGTSPLELAQHPGFQGTSAAEEAKTRCSSHMIISSMFHEFNEPNASTIQKRNEKILASFYYQLIDDANLGNEYYGRRKDSLKLSLVGLRIMHFTTKKTI